MHLGKSSNFCRTYNYHTLLLENREETICGILICIKIWARWMYIYVAQLQLNYFVYLGVLDWKELVQLTLVNMVAHVWIIGHGNSVLVKKD